MSLIVNINTTLSDCSIRVVTIAVIIKFKLIMLLRSLYLLCQLRMPESLVALTDSFKQHFRHLVDAVCSATAAV